MTNDTRTSDEIERDIREQRAQMSSSINSLQEKFSVNAIVTDIGSMFRGQGGDIGRAISQTVGRNPAAVAVIGVGLAWLFLGQNRDSFDDADHDDRGNRRGRGRGHGRDHSWDRPRSRDTGTTIGSGNQSLRDHDSRWFDTAARPGRQADRQGYRGPDFGDEGGSGLTGRLHDAAESVGDAVSRAATNVSNTASDLTERLSHGLDDLSEDARARVVAARHAAHDARLASGAAMNRGVRSTAGFFADQPLVVGALAVAFGAALGGILPHSKLEDDTLGDSSDRLFAQAQTLLVTERNKAMAMARTAASDIKDEVNSARSDLGDLLPEGKSVGEAIVDRAAGAVGRVYDHAAGDLEHKSTGKTGR
ncbi:MAG: DUF3618 domain-containing protein [Paracoccaceae bacterium]